MAKPLKRITRKYTIAKGGGRKRTNESAKVKERERSCEREGGVVKEISFVKVLARGERFANGRESQRPYLRYISKANTCKQTVYFILFTLSLSNENTLRI